MCHFSLASYESRFRHKTNVTAARKGHGTSIIFSERPDGLSAISNSCAILHGHVRPRPFPLCLVDALRARFGRDGQCVAGGHMGGAADRHVVDARGDLCTGTALARDLVLTAAHCVHRPVDYTIKPYQTGVQIPVRTVVRHPRFDYASYAASRATADIAL